MVNLCFTLAEVAAQTGEQTLLERLDPQRRAAVILALVGLALLGVLLVVVVLLAGRWARQSRLARSTRLSSDPTPQPRRTSGQSSIELHTGETLYEPPGEGETKA